MSAANFETMRDFSLFAKNYVVEMKRCKVCGSIMEAGAEECDYCGTDELESICEFDDLAYMEDEAEITAKMDEFNDGLMFHKLGMQSGYYFGVQFIVETEYDLSADDYDNDDCRYYFDCCRSAAYRKYAAEIRKINRFMEKLGKAYGFEELVCTGRFSNGEATFAPASNSRARLYAAIA